MNVEETTTAHFSRNQVQLALYPVVVRFVLEGEDRVRKGALAFLSQDRLHDFQQVEKFEELVFKYL